MIDRAPEVAAFLVERSAERAEPDTLWAEMERRWPGLTTEEGTRGARIAEEILATTLAENKATCAAVAAQMSERRAAAAAIAHLGEAGSMRPATPDEDDHADRDR